MNVESMTLVYQGGHHNVYCDGEFHIKTSGGYTQVEPYEKKPCIDRKTKRIYKTECSCEKWGNK
jgi:hypothetical protein